MVGLSCGLACLWHPCSPAPASLPAQVFFRLMHRNQHALREQIAGDLWVLYDGLKEALGKELADGGAPPGVPFKWP